MLGSSFHWMDLNCYRELALHVRMNDTRTERAYWFFVSMRFRC